MGQVFRSVGSMVVAGIVGAAAASAVASSSPSGRTPAIRPYPAAPSAVDFDALAAEALSERKPALAAACWTRDDNGPASVVLRYDLTFDAEGREIARGITEDRDASRADVASCLRADPTPLRIATGGARGRAEVRLTLP